LNASFVAKVVLKSSFLCPFVVRFLVQNLACSRTRVHARGQIYRI
jgi:hypothetical protein